MVEVYPDGDPRSVIVAAVQQRFATMRLRSEIARQRVRSRMGSQSAREAVARCRAHLASVRRRFDDADLTSLNRDLGRQVAPPRADHPVARFMTRVGMDDRDLDEFVDDLIRAHASLRARDDRSEAIEGALRQIGRYLADTLGPRAAGVALN